jgi:hypothetical protein
MTSCKHRTPQTPLLEQCLREADREGRRKGELEGRRKGEIEGKREGLRQGEKLGQKRGVLQGTLHTAQLVLSQQLAAAEQEQVMVWLHRRSRSWRFRRHWRDV